jgi:protein-L-isoaspartate(D-aspartate) O-methyltransferase
MTTPTTADDAPPSEQREHMIAADLVARGIRDRRVIDAFRRVPRELFVPDGAVALAYEDQPLHIEAGQTISQPYVVALTLQALALTGNERVLEIGTGTGYTAALLTWLAREVYTVERIEDLFRNATDRFLGLGYDVHAKLGDGTLGWPEHAPYDAIMVSAGGPHVPRALIDELAPGGRLVMPIRADGTQVLIRMVRVPGDGITSEPLEEVRFVPLIGADGVPGPSIAPSRPGS